MREELISCGAVTGLVAALKFEDSAVQAIAAQAVGMLACDQSARQQVCRHFRVLHCLIAILCTIGL